MQHIVQRNEDGLFESQEMQPTGASVLCLSPVAPPVTELIAGSAAFGTYARANVASYLSTLQKGERLVVQPAHVRLGPRLACHRVAERVCAGCSPTLQTLMLIRLRTRDAFEMAF